MATRPILGLIYLKPVLGYLVSAFAAMLGDIFALGASPRHVR